MKKQVVKLSQISLRRLISEAIETRQPGSPLFTPPKDKISERFGAWDRDMKTDSGNEDDDTNMGMMPHNFETAAKETFSIVLDKVAEAFVDTHMDMIEAGFSPESHDAYREQLMEKALKLKQAMMGLIEEYSDEFSEEL